ncbi:hypothetical protein [Azospirillum palustre]
MRAIRLIWMTVVAVVTASEASFAGVACIDLQWPFRTQQILRATTRTGPATAPCLAEAARLPQALWRPTVPDGWPSWTSYVEACLPYLNHRAQAQALLASYGEMIAVPCPSEDLENVGGQIFNAVELDGASRDLLAVHRLLQSVGAARRRENASQVQLVESNVLRINEIATMLEVLRDDMSARQAECRHEECVANVRLAAAYACLHLSSLQGKTDGAACAMARLGGLGDDIAGVAELKAAAGMASGGARDAGTVIPMDGGVPSVLTLPNDTATELRGLADRAGQAWRNGRVNEAARLLAIARDLIGRNRLAISEHERSGATWLSDVVDNIFEQSLVVAESERSKRGSSLATVAPLLAITEERRRYEIVSFFRSDCRFTSFDAPRDHTPAAKVTSLLPPKGAEGAAIAIESGNTWIVTITRVGTRVMAVVLKSEPLSAANGTEAAGWVHWTSLSAIEPALAEWKEVALGDGKPLPSANARRLLRDLLGLTARPQIKTWPSRLIIIPDAWAAGIPFAALSLRGTGSSLIDDTSLVMIPSLVDGPWPTLHTDPPPGPPRILMGGLAASAMQRELAGIASSFSEAVRFDGQNFTYENLFKIGSARSFDILHLATHARFTTKNGVAVTFTAPDGAAQKERGTAEISTLAAAIQASGNHPLELMIFSACETAKGIADVAGTVGDGRELGLLSLVLRTGVRSSIGTLWEVNSASSEALMVEFYANLRRGCTKDEALRQAQQTVRSRPATAHPYHWSGYIFSGDWTQFGLPKSCSAQ